MQQQQQSYQQQQQTYQQQQQAYQQQQLAYQQQQQAYQQQQPQQQQNLMRSQQAAGYKQNRPPSIGGMGTPPTEPSKRNSGNPSDLASMIAAKAASRKPMSGSPTKKEFPQDQMLERLTRSSTNTPNMELARSGVE